MKIFALGDLHLSLTAPWVLHHGENSQCTKPMDIFGEAWLNHTEKIYENWQDTVGDDDIVLIPGDISWAMTLAEAQWDLAFVGALNGRKIMLRGNHDYWWHSPVRIRSVLPPSIEILQNDAVILGDVAISGTRLWSLPCSSDFTESDQKIYQRELIRLELSLKETKGLPTINMFHYMPTNELRENNDVIDILKQYNVDTVIYGHLHDKSHRIAVEGEHWQMNFHLVSSDYLKFTPKLIREI